MKILIVYATKSGTTEDCAKEIKKELNQDVDLINLNSKYVNNINNYDVIIIGTPIYAGNINSKVKSFCTRNIEKLKSKNLYFYTCGLSTDEEAFKYLSNSISKELIDKSKKISHFGGELRPEKLGIFLGFIASKMLESSKEKYKVNASKITSFVNTVLNS